MVVLSACGLKSLEKMSQYCPLNYNKTECDSSLINTRFLRLPTSKSHKSFGILCQTDPKFHLSLHNILAITIFFFFLMLEGSQRSVY